MENISLVVDPLILVANGEGSPGTVQVLDMGKNTICRLAHYPEKVRASAGGLLRNYITICGGYNPDTGSRTASCYQHNQSNNSWSLPSSLHTARGYHASVELDGGLWVTGGYDRRNDLSSTDMMDRNGSVVRGSFNWFLHTWKAFIFICDNSNYCYSTLNL